MVAETSTSTRARATRGLIAVRMSCAVTTRPHLRRIAATVATCLVAVVATACGGSSATEKDVIARGNAICSSAVSSVRAVAPPAKGASSGTALAGYFKQLEQLVAAAQRSDIPGVAKYFGALRASPAQSLAQKYGMSQCAAAAGTGNP